MSKAAGTLSGHEVFEAELTSFEETEDGRLMASVRILKAGLSKNRRNYPSHLVQEAVNKGLFNGLHMFLNHDRKRPNPGERDFNEVVSVVESTSWDEKEQAMNGRVEFFDRSFYDKAQRAKSYLGVSINALVRGNRRTIAGETFEDVTGWTRPRSVDWVWNPAAGGAILAFEDEDEDVIDWSKVTVEDLKKNAPQVYEAIESAKGPDDDEDNEDPAVKPVDPKAIAMAVAEAMNQRDEDQAEKDRKIKSARTLVQKAFDESGLPEAVSKRVMRSFEDVEEFDDKAVAEAITEAKEELKAIGAGPHIKGEGPTGGASETSTKTFSVHESVKDVFGFNKPKSSTKSDDPEEGTK